MKDRFTVWPDLSRDQKAWELAKAELGTDAHIHALVDRAVRIKESLKGEAQQ